MIPGPALSNRLMYSPYLYPDDDRRISLTNDYEYGGIAIRDPGAGLRYQVWHLRLNIVEPPDEPTYGEVFLSAENTLEFMLFQGIGITQCSLAFDQNMNPFVGYAQNGEAKYYWYDTVTAQMVHSTLPAGSTPPRACMDDKRPLENSVSDIIMCYTRDENLYFRAQRDRYTIEYLLQVGVGPGQVLNIGMNHRLRLQIFVGIADE